MERNHLCKCGKGYHEEYSCEIICNLDQWLKKKTDARLTTDKDLSGEPCADPEEGQGVCTLPGNLQKYRVP